MFSHIVLPVAVLQWWVRGTFFCRLVKRDPAVGCCISQSNGDIRGGQAVALSFTDVLNVKWQLLFILGVVESVWIGWFVVTEPQTGSIAEHPL